jgi:hypothetical protein
MFEDGFSAAVRTTSPITDDLDATVVSWFTPFMFSQTNHSATNFIENQLHLPTFVPHSELNEQSLKGNNFKPIFRFISAQEHDLR